MSVRDEHPGPGVLSAYEAGELSDDQAAPVERHLSGCAACREALTRRRTADPDAASLKFAWELSQSVSGGTGMGGTAVSAVHDDRTAETALPPSQVPPKVGAWLTPDYERVQLCGEGAYGSVWVVRDRVGVYRAMKVINLRRVGSRKVSANGERERLSLETYCRRVGRHPYLIQVNHVGAVGDQLYYTMELADNDVDKRPVTDEFPELYRSLTLATVLRRRRIKPDTAAEIARRLLRGLSHLHKLDLVHRDIKPANIVIVKRMPKLADIGMVTVGVADGGRPGIIGTPRYMPPDRIIDKTADTYAMGKVLHEMICGDGHPSFPALGAEFVSESGQWDMGRISEVIVRACSPAAADRYPSAAEMLENLEACAESPIQSLLDSLIETDTNAPTEKRGPTNRELLLAAIRAVPWVAGIVGALMVMSWLT